MDQREHSSILSSFLGRHKQSSKHSDLPRIDVPPPGKTQREEKERKWLASIGASSGRSANLRRPATAPATQTIFDSAAPVKSITKKRSFLRKREAESDARRQAAALMPVAPSQSLLTPSAQSLVHHSSLEGFAIVQHAEAKSNRLSAITLKARETTKSLAVQLEELSVAHEDGLINADEYRTLREAVFARMTTRDAPVETIEEDMLQPLELSPQRIRRKPSSIRSARSNVSSVFRRATSRRSLALEEDWRSLNVSHQEALHPGADTSSLFSGRTSTSKARSRFRQYLQPQDDASNDDLASLPPRSSASVRRSPSIIRSPSIRSGVSSAAMSRTMHSSSSTASSSLRALENDPEASVEDLRHEIRVLEAEHTRLSDEFASHEARLQQRLDDMNDDPAGRQAVLDEVGSTRGKQEEVRKRYGERLSYLRERLRAAVHKEKLKRR